MKTIKEIRNAMCMDLSGMIKIAIAFSIIEIVINYFGRISLSYEVMRDADGILQLYTVKLYELLKFHWMLPTFAIVIAGYGYVRSKEDKGDNKWVLKYLMPISKKNRMIAEAIEVCLLTVFVWGMNTLSLMVSVNWICNQAYDMISMTVVAAEQQVLFQMVKLLPFMIVYALYVYSITYLLRMLAPNEVCSILFGGSFYLMLAVLAERFGDKGKAVWNVLADFLFVNPLLLVSSESHILGKGMYLWIVLVTVILGGISYYLYRRMDLSNTGNFAYLWAEIVFYVSIFVITFICSSVISMGGYLIYSIGISLVSVAIAVVAVRFAGIHKRIGRV